MKERTNIGLAYVDLLAGLKKFRKSYCTTSGIDISIGVGVSKILKFVM